MDPLIEAMLTLSRRMTTKRMTADGVVSDGPCYLFDIHLAATAGGATTNNLHLGTTTGGPIIVNLNTLTSTSFNYCWLPPIWCPYGLYLDVGLNLDEALFHILEMNP